MKNSELEFKLKEVLPKFSAQFQKKMLHSIELLRKAERLAKSYDKENGYFLAFSGGKDSQCLYHIAKLAGVQFQAHMNLTSVDPPEVIRFVREQYPDVELAKPHDSIFNVAIRRRILPTRCVRWCCEEYKEMAGAGKVTLIGIRKAESVRRAKRNEVEINNHSFSGTLDELEDYRKQKTAKAKQRKAQKNGEGVTIVNADGERVLGCIRGKESLLISPIIEWTDKEVWLFLNTLGIAHCELYDQGYHRIGCILCPMSSPKQKAKEMMRWPHVKRNWIKAIKAIRAGGGFSKRIYLVEHQTRPHSVRQPQRIATETNRTGTYSRKTTQGFSDSSSSDSLTEEQQNEIAENIFDWWVSGKSYKQWYADKFIHLHINFND